MPDQTHLNAFPYPLDSDAIDVAGDIQGLADAVDTSVVVRFASTTERDTMWPSPPSGARCAILYENIPVGYTRRDRYIDFVYQYGEWWPKGIFVHAWQIGVTSFTAHNTFVPVTFNTSSINLEGRWNGNAWFAPFHGYIRLTAGQVCTTGTVQGQDDILGDHWGSLIALATPPGGGTSTWQFASTRSRWSQHTFSGMMLLEVGAGHSIQVGINVAASNPAAVKTLYGTPTNNNGLMIEYV